MNLEYFSIHSILLHKLVKLLSFVVHGNYQNFAFLETSISLNLPFCLSKILLKSGPYGYYVQLGEDRKGYTPKRAPVSEVLYCYQKMFLTIIIYSLVLKLFAMKV